MARSLAATREAPVILPGGRRTVNETIHVLIDQCIVPTLVEQFLIEHNIQRAPTEACQAAPSDATVRPPPSPTQAARAINPKSPISQDKIAV